MYYEQTYVDKAEWKIFFANTIILIKKNDPSSAFQQS